MKHIVSAASFTRLFFLFRIILPVLLWASLQAGVLAQYRPHEQLGPLFKAVQLQPVFPDSKTFTDCIPKAPPEKILQAYEQEKSKAGFDLKGFVLTYFEMPPAFATNFQSDPSRPVADHIKSLWPVLTRQPSPEQSSLIPLPKPYVVPGGRFREIYYWDSYFTMLGLQESGEVALIQHMVDNFAYLINTVGHIPNGNRSYYVSRSQPPFFALMLRILAKEKGREVLTSYAPVLLKEYAFWMEGAKSLSSENPAHRRVVRLPDGSILNRYWDDDLSPRPEAYKEDVEVAHASGRNEQEVYRDLRAAAESGWDFSSRWFGDGKSLAAIRTTELVPVDLNCLLYHMELTLADMAHLQDNKSKERHYRRMAEARRNAILKYCWSEAGAFFFDYDLKKQTTSNVATLAGVAPLFFCIATKAQAEAVAQRLKDEFLQQGGLATTLNHTGQQWDAPNGWAPLQWMSIQGLRAYKHHPLANTIAQRWVEQNVQVYQRTGKLTEKYNVEVAGEEGGGGEYPNQDGFGWTNGVLLRLLQKQATMK
ncbi:alpha,alpha-trehalase TreF [Rufibacter quisquiliarum]|uniref:Alpha,alpha-trehalase n=1 Tax=Rufibacter quisquiliarum TaxID=1549639 RepID=A0A839GND1_9BACT|nr:alpha,alpha-trehalase TreF [Rufibacter quisquiliarum]MBA9076446.1 alpha,alpha-trehalase [Rufibacter quisquiliarum]